MTDYAVSENEQVQQFLDDLMATDIDKYEIVQQARHIMLACHPQADETIKYGGILFALDEDFGGLFVSLEGDVFAPTLEPEYDFMILHSIP